MKPWAHGLIAVLSSLWLVACTDDGPQPTRIGFLVKQAEEPWFQDEWRFADAAAREHGFTVVKIGVPDGEKVMNAIDNLAAQRAQGFIICAPDVRLGSAIVARARQYGLKVMSVDDRLVNGKGEEIESVPHMGISGRDIGRQVGEAIAEEMQRRGWDPAEVGAIRIAYDQLPTAYDRTMGAVDALTAAGLPRGNIIDAPQTKTDTEYAFNAANVAMTAHPRFKRWVAFGLNDEAALGAVRAAEGRGFDTGSMIAVGIGGSRAATSEFAKAEPTPFYGTILISPKRHGYETALNLFRWIEQGVEPPPLVHTEGLLMTRDNVDAIRAQMAL